MAIISISKNNIPLKAYLRADSNSQHFQFCDGEGELVTDDMFWGKSSNDRLYLDYANIANRSIQISEGISESNGVQILHNSDCDEWIVNNLITPQLSKFFVIQGYAGCGKTTFINHLIYKGDFRKNSILIDIGQDWSYPQEPHMFFNETLNALYSLVDNISKLTNIRNKVWKKFIELGINGAGLDLEIPNAVLLLDKAKKDLQWNVLARNIREILNDKYGGKENSIWHNYGQTQTLVLLIMLLKCAESYYKGNSITEETFSIIFDNLDVITDPIIPAENVILLWGVISRYNTFKELYMNKANEKLPNFKIFITVRKVLFSHITSNLPDLEMIPGEYNPNYANVCDISDLYLSQEILTHRINYWEKNIAEDEETVKKLTQLKEIINVHDKNVLLDENRNDEDYVPKSAINLDAFVNHNYRAFSNTLSALLDNGKYTELIMQDFKSTSSSKEWQKVGTLIFLLSLLYRKEKVWNDMGFGCNDFNAVDYPTTLNRLILNYLYVAKRGQSIYQFSDDKVDTPINNYVSLSDITNILKKVKFLSIDTSHNTAQINHEYETAINQTEDLILDRLADMCARKPKSSAKAYGYDPDNDELWRRPLYFIGGVKLKHTATSQKEFKEYFRNSIDEGKADQILFSITDEGFVLIRDMVTSFEFYSGRYCNEDSAKPLHQVTSHNELNALIQPVYDAVKRCCDRSIFFMNQYMEKYKIPKDKYLKQYFHPRTNPRFDNPASPTKKLDGSTFRAQLHIVRVIYAHVSYFYKIFDILLCANFPERDKLCEGLLNWAEEYLKLYKEHFFCMLENTICNSDNNVHKDLSVLLKNRKIQLANIKCMQDEKGNAD